MTALPLGSSGGTSYGMVAILRSSAPAEEEGSQGLVEILDPIGAPAPQVHDRARLLELGQSLGDEEGEGVLREERLVGAATELARKRDLSPRAGEATGLERRERKKKGRVLAGGGIGRCGIQKSVVLESAEPRSNGAKTMAQKCRRAWHKTAKGPRWREGRSSDGLAENRVAPGAFIAQGRRAPASSTRTCAGGRPPRTS